ncbi:MAG: DUF523 domain-containing protein [Desulfotomaculales bacterium]
MERRRYLVSACLAGETCAYDGQARTCPAVVRLVREGRAVPVCPERLGGLPVPRPPAEIKHGSGRDVLTGRVRVVDRNGQDVTDAYIKGARAALDVARAQGIRAAILKSRSPSCGCCGIYDGTFTGRLRPGDGVTAALLRDAGFAIFTEKDAEAGNL